MSLIRDIGNLIDQTKNRSLKKGELEIELRKIQSQAEQFERTYDLEYKNSPAGLAERKAELLFEIHNCKSCAKKLETSLKDALANYKKIGSVKDQIERGERIIIKDPDREINDLRTGNTLCTCDSHRKNAFIIRELKKIKS